MNPSTRSADPTLLSDAELWMRVRTGSLAAFESIVARHQAAVSGTAYCVCGDLAASEDVAQETFLAAWRDRDELRDPPRLRAWLCSIARNIARSHRRKPAARPISDDLEAAAATELTPEAAAISRDDAVLLWECLNELPEDFREPLVLYYREGESLRDVATALGLSEDAARQRLTRGRAMIRDHMLQLVEGALQRTRPSRAFCTRVMAGVAALGVAGKAASAAASLSPGALTGAAAAATAAAPAASKAAIGTKSLAAGAGAGVGMGLVGSCVGLLGGWLGGWIPAQLAPTKAERDYLLAANRRMLIVSVLFTAALMAAVLLLTRWPAPQHRAVTLVVVLLAWMTAFGITVAVHVVRLNRGMQQLRALNPEAREANDSALKTWLQRRPRLRGRSWTSRGQLWGLPWIDVQFSTPQFAPYPPAIGRDGPPGTREPMSGTTGNPPPRVARGWLAFGDRADGILLAMGGRVRGLIAFGGVAIGVVAFGGIACGVVALGGLALGGCALGGVAGGGLALGGLAIGWHAVGGGALAWDTAVGGAAGALHAAHGGAAWARDFAVGDVAWAAHANDEAAHRLLDNHWLKELPDAWKRRQPWVVVFLVAPPLLASWLIQRIGYERIPAAEEHGPDSEQAGGD